MAGNSRRRFISKSLGMSTAFLSAMAIFTGCKENTHKEQQTDKGNAVDPCGDLAGVSENDIAVRKKLGYVNESPIPDNECNNCNLFLPPKEGEPCGGCILFKGPVYASAYCTYWAPKT